jgi:hypothetical protein
VTIKLGSITSPPFCCRAKAVSAASISERAQGVILLSSPLIFLQRPQIAELALKARMPTISLFTSFPRACGVSASSSEVSAPVALIPSSDA